MQRSTQQLSSMGLWDPRRGEPCRRWLSGPGAFYSPWQAAGGPRSPHRPRRISPFGVAGGPRRELVHADDLAVQDRVNLVEASLDFDSASAPAASEQGCHDDAIPRVHELLVEHVVLVAFGLPPRQSRHSRIDALDRRLVDRVPNMSGSASAQPSSISATANCARVPRSPATSPTPTAPRLRGPRARWCRRATRCTSRPETRLTCQAPASTGVSLPAPWPRMRRVAMVRSPSRALRGPRR